MAIFLDCAQELRSFRMFALASLAVVIACIVLVLVLVLLLSKRAIDPVVRSAERQKQFITDAGHEAEDAAYRHHDQPESAGDGKWGGRNGSIRRGLRQIR